MLRQPIVAMMGHVDHGKTSVLDSIRGSAVAAKEVGGITQAIGASIIPLPTIKAISGPLLDALKIDLKIPGLLFIDTPGHAAFTSLRKRGGNLADIAVVVIDIMQGVQPQTLECLDILRLYKTPFIIALNKVDLINGWQKGAALMQSINNQAQSTQTMMDTKLYEVVGKLFEIGFNADRFDRISDHTKQIALVPVSAKTGEGIPELLMLISGLSQRFLAEKLVIHESDPAKGTVLETRDEKGLGKVLDVIIYDGTLHVGDDVVIGGTDAPVVGKIKAMLLPAALMDMRDKKAKFTTVQLITAATGVRLNAPGAEDALAGMPLRATSAKTLENDKKEVQKEVGEVLLETDDEGVIVKADSLGSLEALLRLLKEHGVAVKKAGVGPISKGDIAAAEASSSVNPFHAVILGFNIPQPEKPPVKVFTNAIIYALIDDYKAWVEGEKINRKKSERDKLPFPAKIALMRGHVFRQNNPAVVGVEVQLGSLKAGVRMMKKDGVALTTIKGIQKEQETVEAAERNQQVAVSLTDVTIGRQLMEADTLYTYIDEKEFRALKDIKDQLKEDEKDVLREIALIMREKNPVWGV